MNLLQKNLLDFRFQYRLKKDSEDFHFSYQSFYGEREMVLPFAESINALINVRNFPVKILRVNENFEMH